MIKLRLHAGSGVGRQARVESVLIRHAKVAPQCAGLVVAT
jgi:hypothetical protein